MGSQKRGGFSLVLLGLGSGLLWPAPSTTASAADQPVSAAASSAQTAERLVPQLGSELFAVRESTTAQLKQMGIEVKPALVAALDDSDPEIRTRARRILTSVVDADFQHRLALFAADVNDAKHYKLPGWSRFRKLVGSDRAARNLFVEMQRAESNLMEAYDEGHEAAALALATRIRAAQFQFVPRGRIGLGGNSLSLGSIAALLFVASDKNVKVSDAYALELGNLAYGRSLQEARVATSQFDLFKRIMGIWIARDASQDLAYQNLYLAIQFNLKEGLDPAIRLLQQPGALPHVKPIALLTIAEFGGKQHLAIVEPFMAGAEICGQVDVNGERYTTQLRDVALFVSVRLVEQDPKNFGFSRVPPSHQLLYQLANFGFRTANERDEAFKKWDDWRTANLPPRDSKAAPSKSKS